MTASPLEAEETEEIAAAASPPPEADVASIGSKSKRGLRWSLVGAMASKVGSFGMALVLARLLAPADFGIYAIALAVTQFVMHVNDVGLIAATVQWRGKLEDMAPTASTLALGFSVILYGAIWFTAPSLAALAGSPGATGVIRLLTFTMVIDGITAVRAANLMRTFRQDKLTVAIGIGFVATASVTIGLAASGAGAYSFAGGQVAGAIVTAIFVLYWGRVSAWIGFDRAVAAKLMRFGLPLAASLGVEAILMNADYVIVGNAVGAATLGLYLLAFNVSSWVPGVVTTAVRYVSVAGFSRLSEQTPQALSLGVQRAVPVLVTGIVPVAVLIGVLAPQLILVLFGGPWVAAAPVLSLLMILTVIRMLTAFALDILTGAGATRAALWLNAGWAIALVPALLIGVHVAGIRGAGAAHAIVAVLVALPLAGFALHRSGVQLAPIWPALARPLLSGVLASVVALAVARAVGGNPALELFLGGAAGFVAYLLAAVPREAMRKVIGRLKGGRAEKSHAVT
jgi:O-antigen/teichoic acid export membrane protein